MADRNSREIKEGGKRIVHSRAIKEGGKGSLKGGRFPKGEDSPNPLLPNLYRGSLVPRGTFLYFGGKCYVFSHFQGFLGGCRQTR